MFQSIVVPVDVYPEADRALPIAVALARRARIPLELVRVSRTGVDAAADAVLLELRRSQVYGARTTQAILRSVHPVEAIVDHLDACLDPLVVIGTHAGAALGDMALGSAAGRVLAVTRHPALLVGPHVSLRPPPAMSTLLVAVDGTPASEVILPLAARFVTTFHGNSPWVVEVDPDESDGLDRHDVEADGPGLAAVRQLQRLGVAAELDVVYGRRRALALLDMERHLPGSMVALACDHLADWWSGHVCAAESVTRQSHGPVLVVSTAAAAARAPEVGAVA